MTMSFKVYCTNSKSLRNEMDEVRLLSSNIDIIIIIIRETWFNLKDRKMPSECNVVIKYCTVIW